jgi:hypothetical protein
MRHAPRSPANLPKQSASTSTRRAGRDPEECAPHLGRRHFPFATSQRLCAARCCAYPSIPTRRPECPEEAPPWFAPRARRSRLEQPASVGVRVPGRRAPAPTRSAHIAIRRALRGPTRISGSPPPACSRSTGARPIRRASTAHPIPPATRHPPARPVRRRRPRRLWPAPPAAAGRAQPGSAAAPPARPTRPTRAAWPPRAAWPTRGRGGSAANPASAVSGQQGCPGWALTTVSTHTAARCPRHDRQPVRPPALGVRTAGRHSRPVTLPARMRGAGTHPAGLCTTPVDIARSPGTFAVKACEPYSGKSHRPAGRQKIFLIPDSRGLIANVGGNRRGPLRGRFRRRLRRPGPSTTRRSEHLMRMRVVELHERLSSGTP